MKLGLLAGSLASLLVLAPSDARADGDVSITLNADGQMLATQLGIDVAELERRIETQIADAYDTANVEGFLRSFANATSFASRGVGVDYAPLFRGVELGVTANIAAAVDGLEEGDDPVGGVAPNFSIMGGLNLARWNHPEIVIYGNGFHRNGTLDELSGSITNVGVHGQYHLFYPSKDASTLILLWTGLHLTAGVEMSRWKFAVDDDLTRDTTVDGDNGASTTITTTATGRFDLSATSTTLPIEVTTSARILYFAGVYFGGGLDLQIGKASAAATLDGVMQGTDPSDGSIVNMGTAVITANGEESPSPIAYHLLAGVELNLWKLKAFVQATLVPVDGASLAFGLRLKL
ncbi:MAG TPA: hypothetical protein VM261_26120 [Kofleriaceae bacterium]|nr:hypothetical protein [Kofleriaceae bacterium]